MTETPLPVLALAAGACMTVTGAVALGYLVSKKAGALVLFVLASLAVLLCVIGALYQRWADLASGVPLSGLSSLFKRLPPKDFSEYLAWMDAQQPEYYFSLPGLLVAMIVVALLGGVAGYKLAGRRGAISLSLLWLGWCAACLWGYRVAGLAGLLWVTLPLAILFWSGMYVLAQYLLPLKPTDRLQAFRALVTFMLGTNRPYYTLENRKAILQMKGDRFRQFLAGPGLVLSGCDHTAVISDGIKIKEVMEPGLLFTESFNTVAEVIDLRFQLRSVEVEALTRDGIHIKARLFVPFRIHADHPPALGQPFPFRRTAVTLAVREQPVEHLRERRGDQLVENRHKRTWDEMVGIVAPQVFRRIIGEYSFDDLCAPYQPDKNPRQGIIREFQQQLQSELKPVGIQVLGGGVSDLLPVDDDLVQQRIANWQAEWLRRITVELGKGDAEYIRQVESARAQAQAEMIRTISAGFEQVGADGRAVSTDVIALRFVEALEKMIQSPQVRQALPAGSVETVEAMKRSLEGRAL